MKVDKSFDDFFCSIGIGIVGSTVIVSVGKAVSPYYFIALILFLLVSIGMDKFYQLQLKKSEISRLSKIQ